MKLSDFKGEKAIIVMADLLEPLSYMFGDTESQEFYKKWVNSKPRIPLVLAQYLLKHHSKEVMKMFAILNEVDISDAVAFQKYKDDNMNGATVLKDLMLFISDEQLLDLFHSQGLTTEKTSSISAMENIEA